MHYLSLNNYNFSVGNNNVIIDIENTLESIKIIEDCREYIESFEVIKGSMDDVFINITRKGNKQMISFVSRNLKVFFRDKTAVFFSLLAVLIVLGLYIFFLGDVWVDSFPNIKGVKNLMNCWIIAELIGVTSVTARSCCCRHCN